MSGPSDPETAQPRQLARARADLEELRAHHASTLRLLHTQIEQLARGSESYQARIDELLSENRTLRRRIDELEGVRDEIERLQARTESFAARLAAMTAQIARPETEPAGARGAPEAASETRD